MRRLDGRIELRLAGPDCDHGVELRLAGPDCDHGVDIDLGLLGSG